MEPEVRTRQQYWGDFKPKSAEVSNTHLMPGHGATGAKPDKGAKAPIPKVGSALEGFLLKEAAESDPPEGVDTAGTPGEQPKSNPQAKPLNPRVNVSGREAPKEVKEKKASRYALPSLEKYPLDSYTDVEKAAGYFEKWASQLAPRHRREFCVNLAGRADELGIKVGHEIQKYGSATYGPLGEIEAALDSRKLVVQDLDREVLDKLAVERAMMPAELFAETLFEFDKIAGIDHLYDSAVIDPFYTTFGTKTAADEDGVCHVCGNDSVSNAQLKKLGKTPCAGMGKAFGGDFVKGYKKDPVGIFNSMPIDQKKMLCRMANDVDSYIELE